MEMKMPPLISGVSLYDYIWSKDIRHQYGVSIIMEKLRKQHDMAI